MAELKFPTLEELGRQGGEWALNEFEYKGLTIRQWADKITAGEYQPVKHGHWIEKKNRIICSNCGREVLYNSDYLPQTTHFCYNCGAKMSNGKDFDFNNSLLRSWK